MQTLSLVILLLWLTSFVRTIVNLRLVRRIEPRPLTRTPLVSVIIPARDEERSIEQTVRRFLAQTYPNLEIVVVNDRSVDATADLLARFDDPRLTVIHGQDDPPEGWLGKPWALHQGSLRAKGELLLFVDADILYEPEAVAAAVARIEEREMAMLSLLPRLTVVGFWENVVIPNLAVFALTFLPLWLANRTRLVLLSVGGGPGNLVRADIYRRVGGHEALRGAVVDDVGLARLLRQRGYRTEVARAEHLISVRMYHGLGETVRGFTKNAFAVFGRSYFWCLFFVTMAVVFHILPYVLALTGDKLAIATVIVIAVTRVVLFRAVGLRLDNALFAHPLMIATWCVILLRSAWVTGVRRQLVWRGRRYDASRTRFGAD
jgi:chlorobactene glucosyltransferase